MGITPGRICFVLSDLGVQDYTLQPAISDLQTATLLSSRGWNVDVLTCSDEVHDGTAGEQFSDGARPVAVFQLRDFAFPDVLDIPFWESDDDHLSQKLRIALETLHRERCYDLIAFSEYRGLGFRTIQAKRAGLALREVGILVRMRGSGQWRRERSYQWMHHSSALLQNFLERDSFENADFQMSSCHSILDYSRKNYWKIKDDIQVVPDPLRRIVSATSVRSLSAPTEFVFLGDFEPNAGLKLFLKAIATLGDSAPVTFIGKDVDLGNGTRGSELIRSRMEGRSYRLFDQLTWDQTIEYFMAKHRVAVLPSLSGPVAETVLQCAINEIPFLASKVDGISEIISEVELEQVLLFDPNPNALRRCLAKYLDANSLQRREWLTKVARSQRVEGYQEQLERSYQSCLDTHRQMLARDKACLHRLQPTPLVTVAVPHYNLGPYLPETLASIAAQTYPHLQVVVADDGSTDPDSLRIFEEQSRLYPTFAFLRHTNRGVCATRNGILSEAEGEFFFPLDADNVIKPEMIERMVTAMLHNPHYAAVTCFRLDFAESSERELGKYLSANRPTGGPLTMSCFHNMVGETSGLFRTEHLRAVNGYDDLHSEYVSEDWHLYVKLASLGYHIGVVPEHLYYYRIRPTSRFRNGNLFINHLQILDQYAQIERLPPADRAGVWRLLVSLQHGSDTLKQRCHDLTGQLQRMDATASLLSLELQATRQLHQDLSSQLNRAQDQLRLYRHRMVDQVHELIARLPMIRRLLRTSRRYLPGRRAPDTR